jgi:hypothetical protein
MYPARLAAFSSGLAAALTIASPMAIAPAHAAVGVELEIGPNRAPPALRRERRPPRPREGFVWQPGHWNWDGGRWVWFDGLWAVPPRVRAAWIPGHWAHPGRRWVWIDGHWS